MKLVKMFGITMVAAIAAMAVIGAGTASATLCKKNESPCAAGNQYPVPTTIKAHATGATLSGTVTVTCDSDVTMVHEGEKAGKLFGKVTSLTWSNCKGCTPVTTTLLPSFEDVATGGGNGKLTFLTTKVSLSACLGFVNCTAEAKNSELPVTGGAIGTAAATATNVPVTLSGGLCGTSGKWNAKYVVTEVNGSKTGSIFQE
jgi:hypothetical protein